MPAMKAPAAPRGSPAEMRKSRKKLQHKFVLRCVAYPHAGRYLAECIDLDIVVSAKTPDEAMMSLMQAVEGHLKVVLTKEGLEELDSTGSVRGLLPRLAPLSHRIKYHLYCLLAAISGPDRNFRLFDCPPDVACPSFT